jgi:ferric-chelate reductase
MKVQHTNALATYSKETDVIRLEVIPGSTFFKPRPGQHYYMYQPLSWKGYENHPLTLGAWSSVFDNDAYQLPSVSTHTTKKGIEVSTTAISSGSASSSSRQEHNETVPAGGLRLTFWIRPYKGWTRRLRNECMKASDGVVVRSNILIEGPYGETTPMHNYEIVILIAGGTGISAVVPYIQEHIHRSAPQKKDGKAAFSTRTRRIDLVWTSRQAAYINDVASRELLPALARDDIHPSFFYTQKSGSDVTLPDTVVAQISLVDDNGFGPTLPRNAEIEIEHGRPDIKSTILDVARSNKAEGSAAGRIAILVCGPAGMADEARAAVHVAMKEGCRSIEYIEEAFGW